MNPLLLLIVVPLMAAAVSFGVRSNSIRPRILIPTAILHLLVVETVWLSGSAPLLGGWLALDPVGGIFLALISLLFLAGAFYAVGYLPRRPERDNRIFVACLCFFLFAMTLVTLCQHFGLLWVAIEATTLGSAPLLYFNHNQRSLEATWKYLLICSVGIALALLGTFFLAMSENLKGPVVNSLYLPAMLERGETLSVPWLKVACLFLLVGYGTKMGLAPMHTWKPDAYGEAPGLVGFLLAGALTNCAFLALVRMTQVCQAAGQIDFLKPLYIATGLLSMAVAAVFMLSQKDYKRMLAYSSVEHMGILLLGLGIGGLAAYGAFLHMLNNGLAKGVLFLTAGNIHRRYGTKSVSRVQGVFRDLPLSGGLFMVGFLAITGSPPFGLFISEFTILRSAMAGGQGWVVAAFLVFLAVIFAGMGRIVLSMTQGEADARFIPDGPADSFLTTVSPILMTVAVLILGFYVPSWLDQSLKKASEWAGGLR